MAGGLEGSTAYNRPFIGKIANALNMLPGQIEVDQPLFQPARDGCPLGGGGASSLDLRYKNNCNKVDQGGVR